MSAIMLLGGVQGSGKTTVAEHLKSKYAINVADASSLMINMLTSTFRLNHHDQLRTLPPAALDRAYQQVLSRLAQEKTKSPLVLCTHFVPRRLADVYFPQVYSNTVRGSIYGFVMLVSAPKEIYNRHQQDRSRDRAPADTSLLAAEQFRYLLAALVTAQDLRVPFWVVPNPDGRVDQVVHTISRLIYIGIRRFSTPPIM